MIWLGWSYEYLNLSSFPSETKHILLSNIIMRIFVTVICHSRAFKRSFTLTQESSNVSGNQEKAISCRLSALCFTFSVLVISIYGVRIDMIHSMGRQLCQQITCIINGNIIFMTDVYRKCNILTPMKMLQNVADDVKHLRLFRLTWHDILVHSLNCHSVKCIIIF